MTAITGKSDAFRRAIGSVAVDPMLSCSVSALCTRVVHIIIATNRSGHLVTVTRVLRRVEVYEDFIIVGESPRTFTIVPSEQQNIREEIVV